MGVQVYSDGELYGSVPLTRPNDNPNPFLVLRSHPDAGCFIPQRSPSPPSPLMPIAKPVTTELSVVDPFESSKTSDALHLDEALWPSWFGDLRMLWDRLELLGEWGLVMMYLMILEGRNGFE
ncbi:uncharacterized protein ARMOST_15528 [Armillaria ostoyae]|uniref:Uncharacterized protein n=1 Tax=Armillaria ostoyae TaxID=47428 RepID=A0A284RTN5_ARMOS|nr:uncharacterized protein ARMOST_15528 [Armillaria ostoyae]